MVCSTAHPNLRTMLGSQIWQWTGLGADGRIVSINFIVSTANELKMDWFHLDMFNQWCRLKNLPSVVFPCQTEQISGLNCCTLTSNYAKFATVKSNMSGYTFLQCYHRTCESSRPLSRQGFANRSWRQKWQQRRKLFLKIRNILWTLQLHECEAKNNLQHLFDAADMLSGLNHVSSVILDQNGGDQLFFDSNRDLILMTRLPQVSI